MECEKHCKSCSDMESISKIYKELVQFNHQSNNNNNNNSNFKMGKGPRDIFSKKIYERLAGL